MPFRLLRHTQWPALLFACAASACGSSKPPTMDAFIAATVQDTTSGGTCNVNASTSILAVGEVTDPTQKPTTVSNGGTDDGGGAVTLSCSVTPSSNGGFDVQLRAEQTGLGGGSVTIMGTISGMGTGDMVSADFSNPMVGTYSQDDCTLSYTFDGGPLPLMAGDPAVAGGRIWAHVDCPMAQDTEQTTGNGVLTCSAQADILFENCSGS